MCTSCTRSELSTGPGGPTSAEEERKRLTIILGLPQLHDSPSHSPSHSPTLPPTHPLTLPLTQGRAVDETLPLLQPSLRQQKHFSLLHLPMTHRLQLHAEGERERGREGERERGREGERERGREREGERASNIIQREGQR